MAKVRGRSLRIGLVVAAAVALVFFLSRNGSDESGTSTTIEGASTTTVANVGMTTVPGGSITGDIECPPEGGATERIIEFPEEPPMCIDESKTYVATIETSMGTMVAELYADKAPRTVNSFVTLARYRYFEGIIFHRVIDGFVIQGGDPTGTGGGGPGYKFDDELPQAGEYEIGSLAMANSGPDTNGSQFFVITGPNGAALQPKYSLFGKLVEGLDVADAIQKVSTVADRPEIPVVINTVTITVE